MALAEGVDTVTVHYVVFHPDDSVLMQGQMEVPRSDIHLDENADGGIGTVMRDGLEWTIVHYGDPARSGGEEWYEVERTMGDSENDGEGDDSEWDDDEVTVFRFTIYNSDGSVFSITDEELPPWMLTDNEDPERMLWDGLEYTLEDTCGAPGEEWFILAHTLPEAEPVRVYTAEESEGPEALAEPAPDADDMVNVTFWLHNDSHGSVAQVFSERVPMSAITYDDERGTDVIEHDGVVYTVGDRGEDHFGHAWAEVSHVPPESDDDADDDVLPLPATLVTYDADGCEVSAVAAVLPRTAIVPNASGLGTIIHEGDEYTVVERVDEPGSQWCEAHRALPASENPEEDGEMITIDLTTHYGDGWVDERRVRVPGTAVYFRGGDLRVTHEGQEYTFQNIYEACEGGVYTAWRDGDFESRDVEAAAGADAGLAAIAEESADERGADGSGHDESSGW